MIEKTDVTTQPSKAAQEARAAERAIRPAVDIFEDATGITVRADMPGVSRDRLEVHLESDSLSIVGEMSIPMPDEMEAVYADVTSTRYQRSFSLSRELDGNNIEASLSGGVLSLRIPRREEHKPRRIEVRTG